MANSDFGEKHRLHDGGVDMVTEEVFVTEQMNDGYSDLDGIAKALPLYRKAGQPGLSPSGVPAPFGVPAKVTPRPHATVNTAPPITLDSRPSWDEYFLNLAAVVATRGTCSRLQVGAVLVSKDRRILSTGYNGAPAGTRHCNHTPDGGDLDSGHCSIAEHAEGNCLLYSDFTARQGATMYLTCQPCLRCCRQMVTSGVTRVVFRARYGASLDPIERLCAEAGVHLVHVASPTT